MLRKKCNQKLNKLYKFVARYQFSDILPCNVQPQSFYLARLASLLSRPVTDLINAMAEGKL